MDNPLLAKFRKELINTEKKEEAGNALGNDTTKLKNRAKRYIKAIQNLERNNDAINALKRYSYYTIKIAHNKNNLIHNAILCTQWDLSEGVIIFNQTYERMAAIYDLEDIFYFEIVQELKEMNFLV